MKKGILTQVVGLIFTILLLTGCGGAPSKTVDFTGHWEDPGTGFTLDLSQTGEQIQGMHVVVAQGGNKIDSLDNSIKGDIKENKATVTFQSSFAASAGTAEISVIDENTIFWKIITTPSGEYYLPQQATLIKKASASSTPASSAGSGTITGEINLSAPPTPAMVVYAVDPTSGLWAFAETQATDGVATFTITVPPGTYQVFGAVASGTTTGLGYSLDDRTLAFVTVAANQTISDINVRPPSQWACGSTFGTPASPDGRFAEVTVATDCPAATQEALNQQPQSQSVIDGGRVQFQANTDTWYTNGSLSPSQSIRFSLYAMQGQQMIVNLSADPYLGADLIVTAADGSLPLPVSPMTTWNSTLSASQDYYVEVRSISKKNVNYTIEVKIPASAGSGASSLSYAPVSAEVCQVLQEMASQSVALSFSMDPNGYFADPLTGETGKGCILTAMATGMQLSDPASVVSNLVNGFLGWEEQSNYQADGPTGSATAMTRDMGLLLITVEWIPSPDANCPADQPISACNLTPQQKLYTIQISAAQK